MTSELAALAARVDGAPLLVAIVGSVAVGKTTVATAMAELLGGDHPDTALQRGRPGASARRPLQVEVVQSDAFLLPNSELEPMGGAMVKGYPPSYDWNALQRFVRDAHAGAPSLAVPMYSHRTFDVVPGMRRVFSAPDVVLVEGLNLLQAPPDAPVELAPMFDCSVYLHAPTEVVEAWFVDRFRGEVVAATEDPESFYAMFTGMADDEVDSVARWTWNEINLPNLERHIAPTRDRAHVVAHLGRDHSVQRIEHQHPPRR